MFTTSNFMTLGLMQAMAERGLRCPEDLASVEFDIFPWAEAFRLRLTVVAQPAEQMGRIATRHTRAPIRKVTSGDLKIRESCGTRPRPSDRRAT